MTKPQLASIAAVTATLAAAALASASPAAQRSPAATSAVPSPAALGAVRDRVERWLAAAGFRGVRVSEVMAFSTNDYVAVNDRNGRPAFELLLAPDGTWLMAEPTSMMWSTRYGTLAKTDQTLQPIPGLSMLWGGHAMGSPSSWYGRGTGKVTSLEQAVTLADSWLASARLGERAEQHARLFPGYYTIHTTRGGKTVGMLSVNATTGAIWYHGWHGRFQSERRFAT